MGIRDKLKDNLTHKRYYLRNREKILERNKNWRMRNKEKVAKNVHEYYIKNINQIMINNKKNVLKNKEKIAKRQKMWYLKNREEILLKFRENHKKWYEKNKEKRLIQIREYKKQRLIDDPIFRIKWYLKGRVRSGLKRYGDGKTSNSKKYGIDYNEIIEHLKPFPKERGKYHIDHIKPLCSFDLSDPEQIKIAFAPQNHQWLLAKDNLIKGGRY